ncbi:MAG: threonylcarbamoyl-AMP synthase [Candidatus Omnitrophica bacterium]|nr:threonylcarbamoyl-AMP synthase [Candidatus Omnitrophota bacterium]
MKTKVIKVNPANPEFETIVDAANVIREGGLVIFPTETVYGIAADFNNPVAVKRLREVKRRNDHKPFSILISHKGIIENYSDYNDPRLYKLIDEFWPGPLTVIVPSRQAGETIGIRMPDNLVALRMVDQSQCTIAAPSANLEGKKPPQTCQEALQDLDGLVDLALDGGPVELGRSSSIVDFTHGTPKILRDGEITQADVDKVINKKFFLFVCTGNSCRSVMAEYLFNHFAGDRPDVCAMSAGTNVFFKSTASAETLAVLKQMGIDASKHKSRPVTNILLKKADLIFVMTRTHRMQVLEREPSVEQRIYLLKEFTNIPKGYESDLDIADPIGRSHEAYEECMLTIKEGIEKIVKLI